MASKVGTISELLGSEWTYLYSSCSCQGKKQYELYSKDKYRLKYYPKLHEYQINNEQTKPISQIETDIKA